MSLPRVLFVSKPVVPPFHDGTKCLVRDVALHLDRVHPIVMGTREAPSLGRVETAPVYRDAGAFAPGLADNARAAAWLLLRSRADVWHFVFAPNPRSSAVGRWLARARRVPVVQTVASPPRSFARIDRLLFGDVVVAQSRWTRERIAQADRDAGRPERRIEVVPPPVDVVAPRELGAQRELRERLVIAPDAPIVVYPGDIELGGGAEQVAGIVQELGQELPGVVVVFAYRPKTAEAHAVARRLEQRLPARATRFTDTLPDVLTLIAASTCVLFPVEDLWGKVDLPIVLLESMRLGVPIVALDRGPLAELEGVVQVAPGDRAALVRATLELLREPSLRRRVADEQRAYVEREHAAAAVARRYQALYLELGR